VLKFGADAKPEQLKNIFTLLDNLIVNIYKINKAPGLDNRKRYDIIPLNKKKRKTGFTLDQNIVNFLARVNTFVAHLKRELIYAQSEQIIRYSQLD
jgi:hypothetical protein